MKLVGIIDIIVEFPEVLMLICLSTTKGRRSILKVWLVEWWRMTTSDKRSSRFGSPQHIFLAQVRDRNKP
jgi:hypothetical protein